ISIEMFRKFFKRHYRRIIDLAHSAGAVVQFHCCGCQLGLIPEFIDLGVDIMNPLQTSAKGMVPHKLKEEYGDYISFSGGVDVQTVLPHGTPESVREEVFYLLDTFKNGGYILHPSHNIQVDTPPENVIAMVNAVFEYYGMTARL
ncbi:MAG: methyltransferase, partial [Oscillospiraceae bacterium]|nr:methyltransferase [Oscillospiraceae bacterium]